MGPGSATGVPPVALPVGPGSVTGVPPVALPAEAGRFPGMMRKVFWLLALLAMVIAVSGLVDRRRARLSRELWAEATDQV